MKNESNNLAKVYHYDLYGKRDDKYEFLNNNSINSVDWQEIEYKEPHYFFVPKDFELEEKYVKGFKVDTLFDESVAGIETIRDSITIHFSTEELDVVVNDFLNLEENIIASKYKTKDSRDWKICRAKDDVKINYSKREIRRNINYRPFDIRKTFYSGKQNGFVCNGRFNVMKHMLYENYAIIAKRGFDEENAAPVFTTKYIHDRRGWSRPGMQGAESIFPLYLYSDNKEEPTREPNLNMEIVEKIAEGLGLEFVPEKFPSSGGVSAGRGGGEAEPNKKSRNTQNYLNLPFNPKLKQRARELRKAGNLSEVLLWNQLKNKQFKGYDFDRQKIIGNYIVDFYCTNCNVVIEVDGSSHDDMEEYDAIRDAYLKGLGLEVIHIRDIDVKKNMDGVMRMLHDHPALMGTGETSKDNHPVLTDTPPKEGNSFAPIDILDYIYAVLHSPAYREKYKEFLKIDFPRVPYPKDADTFWKLVEIGKEIREIHLLESPKVEEFITSYPENGDNIITTSIGKKDWKITDEEKQTGRIMLNDKQYFDGIPVIAWKFYIGGYQPAQKWLKDRKGRELSFENIMHYQKIIVALTETARLMKLVDEVGVD